MIYADLETGAYYLLRTDLENDIELVSVLMQTGATVLLRTYLPDMEDFFVLKTDTIAELVEQLDEDTALEFFSLYDEEPSSPLMFDDAEESILFEEEDEE